MRCPDCSKFVSMEMGDVEVEDEGIEGGTVAITARVVRNCADCSTELKEARFEMEKDIDDLATRHEGEDGGEHTYSITVDDSEATESGGGRYKKNMIGVKVTVKVTCDTCNDGEVGEVILEDEMGASEMDELV